MDTCSIYRDCFNYYLYDICGGSRNQLGKEMDISPSDVGKMLKRFKQGGGMGQNADKVLYHLAVEHSVSIDFLIDRMLRNNACLFQSRRSRNASAGTWLWQWRICWILP